jgi:shikimate kinase
MIETEAENIRIPAIPRAPFNVVLLGMTGCGKSTVGWILAQKMNCGFLDLDAWIEKKTGKAISEIFALDGEAGFRDIERKSMLKLQGIRNHVIAVGSGVVTDSSTWEMTKNLGTTVWIDCQIEEIVRRLHGSVGELAKRPLLSEIIKEADATVREKKLRETISTMFAQRKTKFAEANISFSDSFSTAEECARRIQGLVNLRAVKKGRVN